MNVGALGTQKKVLDPLELELKANVSYGTQVLRIQFKSPQKNANHSELLNQLSSTYDLKKKKITSNIFILEALLHRSQHF